MPAAIPIISAIVGAIGAGTSIYGEVQSSRQASQNKADLLKQQQTQANQANLAKQQAILGQQGQAQAQTGGSLTDEGTAALTGLLAGYPGYQGTGTSSTGVGAVPATAIAPTSLSSGESATNSDSPDIASILAALRSGNPGGGGFSLGSDSISGGNWQTPQLQPQNHFELANPVF